MLSPLGTEFIFIYPHWFKPKRWDSLFYFNFEKEKLIPIIESGFVSHFCWLCENEVFVFASNEDDEPDYYRLNIETLEMKLMDNLELHTLGDGHPSFVENSVVIDTYPNKARIQELFEYKLDDNSLNHIREFYQLMSYYGVNRCDLHPRFSGKSIYIDSLTKAQGIYTS